MPTTHLFSPSGLSKYLYEQLNETRTGADSDPIQTNAGLRLASNQTL